MYWCIGWVSLMIAICVSDYQKYKYGSKCKCKEITNDKKSE